MLRFWDTQTWEEVKAVQAHEGGIFAADISSDGRFIATASQDDVTPKIWDTTTLEQLHSLEGHEIAEGNVYNKGVHSVKFSPDGEKLATAGADGTARIWDIRNGELLFTLVAKENTNPDLPEQVIQVLFSPDGRLLVTGTASNAGGRLKIWDTNNGQLLQTIENDPLEEGYWTLAFSPDAKWLAAGGRSQSLEVWQIPNNPWQANDEDAELRYQYPTDVGWIEGINFSPNGERLVVAGDSGLAEIRDAKTGELLLSLQNPAGIIYAMFTPDGNQLITSDKDGVLRIWVIDLDELTALAQSRVTRSLTEAECQQYLHLDACPTEP